MAFEWKEHKNIWKGEGIYFLTFNVVGRQRLLGSLIALSESRFYLRNVERSMDMDEKGDAMHTSSLATVMLTPFGFAVSQELRALSTRVDGLMLCAKQVMPDHIHAVVWIRKDSGRTIRQIGNGFRIGIKKKAIELGVWNSEAGHILDIPYIRTLAHKGQLKSMINYVHANPDNYQNPMLIQLTEKELENKAKQKGVHYSPIPHESKRWRMIAGNVILRMIAGEG